MRLQLINRPLRLLNSGRNLRKAIVYLVEALLRFVELIVQHFTLLHSDAVLRPAFVNRRLRLSQRRLRLGALIGKLGHTRLILGATACQLRFALSNGRLHRFKLGGH